MMRGVIDLINPAENPILLRELRREWRSGKAWLGFTLQSVGLSLWMVFCLCLAHSRLARFISSVSRFDVDLACLWAMWLPLAVIVAIVAGIRADKAFRLESDKRSLDLLLTCPVPAVTLVLQAAVAPIARGLLSAAIGLPFFVLAMATLNIPPADVSVLVFLLFVICLTMPTPPRHLMRWRRGNSAVMGNGIGVFRGWAIVFLVQLLLQLATAGMLPSWHPAVLFDLLLKPTSFFRTGLPVIWPAVIVYALGMTISVVSTASRLSLRAVKEQVRNLRELSRVMNENLRHVTAEESRLRYLGARLSIAMIALLLFVATGYAWVPLVRSGQLGRLVSSGLTTVGNAIAGLTLIYATLAVLGACLIHLRPSSAYPLLRADLEETGTPVSFFQRLCVPVGICGAIYALSCLCGGVSPLAAGARFGTILLLCGAALALRYTFGLWSSELGRRGERGVATAELVVVGIVLLPPILTAQFRQMSLAVPALSAFSPLTSLMSLCPVLWKTVRPPDVPFTLLLPAPLTCAVVQMIAASAFALAAQHLRALRGAAAPIESAFREHLTQRIVGLVQDRWDNAMLVRELRVYLRTSTWLGMAEWLAGSYCVLLTVFAIRPDLFAELGAPVAPVLGGVPAARLPFLGVALLLLAVHLPVMFIGWSVVLTRGFGTERMRGTLTDLFLTPARSIEFVAGKFVAGAVVPLIVLFPFVPFTYVALLLTGSTAVLLHAVLIELDLLGFSIVGLAAMLFGGTLARGGEMVAMMSLLFAVEMPVIFSFISIARGRLHLSTIWEFAGFVLFTLMTFLFLRLGSYYLDRLRHRDMSTEGVIGG